MAEESRSASQPARVPLKHRRKARRLLAQAVYQWLIAETDKSKLLAQYREDNPNKVDWVFFEELLGAVIKNREELESLITVHLDRKLESLDPVEMALLLLGVCELQQRIDVPYRVVINEYVDLAKTFGATDSHKYVNGVLDKLASELRSIEIQAGR